MDTPVVRTALVHNTAWSVEPDQPDMQEQKTKTLADESFQRREDPSSTDVSLNSKAIVQWQEKTGLNFDVRLSLERHHELYETTGKYYPADLIAALGGLEAVHALPILELPPERTYRGPISSNDKNKVRMDPEPSDFPTGIEVMRGFDANGFPFIATCILRNARSRVIIPAHMFTIFQMLEIEGVSWIVVAAREVTAKKDTLPYFDLYEEGEGVANSDAAQTQIDKFVEVIVNIQKNKQAFDRQPAPLVAPKPKAKKPVCVIC